MFLTQVVGWTKQETGNFAVRMKVAEEERTGLHECI